MFDVQSFSNNRTSIRQFWTLNTLTTNYYCLFGKTKIIILQMIYKHYFVFWLSHL